MHDSSPVLGPIFFLLFVVFVYFVLLCMFLAIINHAYLMVKELSIKYGHQLTLGGYLFTVCVLRQFPAVLCFSADVSFCQKTAELWSTMKKVYAANVYPPKINTARANAIAFARWRY